MTDSIMIKARLDCLRQYMYERNIDYYYVPATDAHQSEYVPSQWQRRTWLCGFSGSAGDLLIGKAEAYLWTDGRYYLQAEQELDPRYYQLMKAGQPFVPSLEEWIAAQAVPINFGVDPQLMSIKKSEMIWEKLALHDGKLLSIEENLVDLVRRQEKEMHTSVSAANSVMLVTTGMTVTEKLNTVREKLKERGAQAYVMNVLDEIAWLFNIRGQDIQYNPLAISYAIITDQSAHLFIDPEKISKSDKLILEKIPIHIEPYEKISEMLQTLNQAVWLDPHTASLWMESQLIRAAQFIKQPSPIVLAKAIKNPVEQEGARLAHRADAVAMIRFLHWLELHWREKITEQMAATQLEQFRRDNDLCRNLSFTTISGFGAHGAIIHYSVKPDSDSVIDDSSLYLIDSGGQYYGSRDQQQYCGTTDITRTIHLGQPSEIQKHHYTLVLKGHLALRHAIFPHGAYGEHLDAFARQYLWRENLDYGHGTGHGVGSYLCVHEGPQRISPAASGVALVPGMIVSNEPGLYFPQQYGIRIENLCLVIAATTEKTARPFYTFEDLTLVPYARELINVNELTAQERQWIDDYHQLIFNSIAPMLEAETRQWLEKSTKRL